MYTTMYSAQQYRGGNQQDLLVTNSVHSVLYFVPYIYLFVCNLHLRSYCFSCMAIAVCVSVLLAEFVNCIIVFYH